MLGVSEADEVSQRVDGFAAKLGDPDPKTRACAARQLGYLGPEAAAALPRLIRLMRDEEHRGVGINVSDALWAIGPGGGLNFDELSASLTSEDVYVRLYAAFALGYYKPHPGRAKQTARALADAAGDRDGVVRWTALKGLARIGPAAREALPTLVNVLTGEKHMPLLVQAALAVGNIGPEAESAAPVLLKVLYETKDFMVYTYVALALGRLGPEVLPLLARDMRRGKALHVLEVLSRSIPAGAPLVIEALGMKDKRVRVKALETIAKFGDAARPAVPLIAKELKNPDKEVREKAASALYVLGPAAEAAAPELRAALGDDERMVRCSAAWALGRLGPAGAAAVPELRRMLSLWAEEGRYMTRACAARALMEMGPETRALVPAELVKEVEEFEAMFGGGLAREDDETRPKPRGPKPEPPAPEDGRAF